MLKINEIINICIALLILVALPGALLRGRQNQVIVEAKEQVYETPTPVPTTIPTSTPKASPSPLSEVREATNEEVKVQSLTEKPTNWKEIVGLIKDSFGEDWYMAVRVAHCESRMRNDRVHKNFDGSLDVGLFQINQRWHKAKGNAYDLEENIRIAKQIYDASGWYPWVCFNKYSYGW